MSDSANTFKSMKPELKETSDSLKKLKERLKLPKTVEDLEKSDQPKLPKPNSRPAWHKIFKNG